MDESKKNEIEFGDFQTPAGLARIICEKLKRLGIDPRVVLEPTCGKGLKQYRPNKDKLGQFETFAL